MSFEVLTLFKIVFEEISRKLSKLDLAFKDKIFLTELDSLPIEILPFFNLSAISLIPLLTSVDISMISFPTSKALRSTLIFGS